MLIRNTASTPGALHTVSEKSPCSEPCAISAELRIALAFRLLPASASGVSPFIRTCRYVAGNVAIVNAGLHSEVGVVCVLQAAKRVEAGLV